MTARLYLAPDGYGDPTIWRDTGHDRDEAVLTRTGGNAAGFDALAGLVADDRRAIDRLVDGLYKWREDAERAEAKVARVEALFANASPDEIDDMWIRASDLRAALTDGATR